MAPVKSLLPLIFLLGGLVSCRTEIKEFSFRDAAGAAVALSASTPKAVKEGGIVSLRESLELILSGPVKTRKGEGLRIVFSGRAGKVEAKVRGKNEAGDYLIASLLPETGGEAAEFLLPLPEGEISALEFANTEPGEASFRIAGLGLGPAGSETLVEPLGIKVSRAVLPVRFSREERRFRFALSPSDGKAVLEVAFPPAPQTSGTAPKLTLKGGGRSYSAEIVLRPREEALYFYPSALGFIPDEAELEACPPGGVRLRFIEEKTGGSNAPLPMDLGSMLDYPASAWRSERVEIFRWSLLPNILVFGTPTYEAQNRFFHRLAFFTEKTGYRGRLWTDEALQDKHGWNAHNYGADGLAAFFEKARTTAFPLHEEELWLRDYLLASGILVKEGGAFRAGTGGLLAFSLESLPAHRRLLLTHEAFHGLFYNLPEFRRLSEDLWKKLPSEEKEFWFFFFSWMNYDIRDPYLVVNEFQAYLLQQPVKALDRYFKETILERITEKYPEKKAKFRTLFEKNPALFSRPAAALQDQLIKSIGVKAGYVFSLARGS